ncbi:unnamed protein product [Arabis nemorensis]|uniref:F-box domain-containing protein n=1 Tax=Arabis nemorensis TaxID=586526 RepID=A0A565CDY9_9BRAS|nr:unnamed protein product [Arabis nemorensis]
MVGVSTMSKVVLLSDDKAGFSMIEQLVPEMTTHILSFLDYSSLCSLSMTSSLMGKTANDDNLWKSLYHQDFQEEEGTVTPFNRWKAYYAATKTLMNANFEFVNIMTAKSLPRMSRLWLTAHWVTCFSDSGKRYTGYEAVMERLEDLFDSWEFWFDFDAFDVEARIRTEWAWVTMFTSHHVAVDGPLRITNVFELHDNRWFMVHHYCSIVPTGGAEDNE